MQKLLKLALFFLVIQSSVRATTPNPIFKWNVGNPYRCLADKSQSLLFRPIILLDFRFTKTINGSPSIQWTLAPTDQSILINLLYSTDNINWQNAWSRTEALNGSIKTYEFTPAECFGNNFYKVQIIPKGDDTIDSKIIAVSCDVIHPVAFPNPANDYLIVRSENKNWHLYSSTGFNCRLEAYPVSANEYRFDLRSLKPGYYVVVAGGNKIPFLRL